MSPAELKAQFEQLAVNVRGEPLCYLDSAATTLKPKIVVDAIDKFYRSEVANVHRGAHYLSDKATDAYEGTREKISKFIGAESSADIIFTKGTTEGINLVASSYFRHHLNAGDEIVLTEMEHHSNIVPWYLLAKEKQLVLKWIPVLGNGELDYSKLENLITNKTKLVSVVHCSNTLGTLNDVATITKHAKRVGAKIMVDCAQSVTIVPLNVANNGWDFAVFSGHKMFAPFGVGVLYVNPSHMPSMEPYQGGGGMISEVQFDRITFLSGSHRLEAGTPNVSAVVGLGVAVDFINSIGTEKIRLHERELVLKAKERLSDLQGLKWFGDSPTRNSLLTFNIEKLHPSDLGQILDQQGIAVRVGHLCTQPLMRKLGVQGAIRASFSIYNDSHDVDRLFGGLKKAKEILE